MNSLNKTIVSLVTSPITQNIALIRLSGSETYHIISKIFDRPLPNYPQKNSQLIFGNLINKKKEIVDQVLLLCFYQPRSFTGEDVVEISCHGNLLIVNQILKLVLDLGAELAQPGEFTKQAFFNGKLNLLQANAINDLIRAPTISATKLALHNLEPQTQKELERIEAEFLEIIAIIEVNIDYPEYDGVEYLTGQKVLINLSNFLQKLEEIFTLSKQAKVYQEGIKIAIVGKPNVGKSTLLNTLLQEEKAIVSPLAGTTRDIIEVHHSLNGIPLILFDTAGIREAKNQIEKIGVAKSQAILKKVDLVFFLCDNSRIWSQDDEEIWELVKNKKYLVVINKIDLKKRLILPNNIPTINTVFISAKEEKINQLETKVTELFTSKLAKNISPYPLLSQSWQQSKLTVLIEKIKTIIQALQEKIPLDVISTDLQSVYQLLRELSGKDYQVDFLDVLFSKFCLGK